MDISGSRHKTDLPRRQWSPQHVMFTLKKEANMAIPSQIRRYIS